MGLRSCEYQSSGKALEGIPLLEGGYSASVHDYCCGYCKVSTDARAETCQQCGTLVSLASPKCHIVECGK